MLGLTRTATAIEQDDFHEEMLARPCHSAATNWANSREASRDRLRKIQREQSLAELNQNLEHTVGQRTAELTARAGQLE